jgi:hypothetical protein
MLTSSNNGVCFTLLTSLLALITIETVILLGAFLFDVHALKTEISDQTNATSSSNNNLRKDIERRLPYEELDSIRPPFVSPNPVGPPGQVNFRANETGVGKDVESVNISIKGPNLGSTNPLLSPKTIGFLSMIPLSNTSQDGSWTGNFSFPPSLPDGNYVYSLTTRDRTGQERTTDSFSGIILNRNPPDIADTNIVSAIDGHGKQVSNNSITASPNITFTFEGTDRSGVIQTFECNLDDIVIRSEHDHGDVPDQNLTTYSTCSVPLSIASHIPGNHTYAELTPGNHTFKVRAIDNEHDTDPTPSIFSWIVLPPQT